MAESQLPSIDAILIFYEISDIRIGDITSSYSRVLASRHTGGSTKICLEIGGFKNASLFCL